MSEVKEMTKTLMLTDEAEGARILNGQNEISMMVTQRKYL